MEGDETQMKTIREMGSGKVKQPNKTDSQSNTGCKACNNRKGHRCKKTRLHETQEYQKETTKTLNRIQILISRSAVSEKLSLSGTNNDTMFKVT